MFRKSCAELLGMMQMMQLDDRCERDDAQNFNAVYMLVGVW